MLLRYLLKACFNDLFVFIFLYLLDRHLHRMHPAPNHGHEWAVSDRIYFLKLICIYEAHLVPVWSNQIYTHIYFRKHFFILICRVYRLRVTIICLFSQIFWFVIDLGKSESKLSSFEWIPFRLVILVPDVVLYHLLILTETLVIWLTWIGILVFLLEFIR